MDAIVANIAFGVGRMNNEDVDHELFDDEAWKLQAVAPLKEMARKQLGTVGSGNHYVDVFAGDDGYVWVGVHFGSRGLGHKIATHFLKAGGAQEGIDADPLVLKVGTPLADDYLACMELAGRYAYAGRDWVCQKVAEIIGVPIIGEVHNHHNFAWQEEHFGEKLWVVRKGATPAFPGQKSFVGGSMGDNSYILQGRESDYSADTLYSTVHGAGRVMSRTQARGKFNRKTGERKTEGAISKESMQEWIDSKGVVLRGADVDEAPQAYKRISNVLSHHADSVGVVHVLRPMGVAMAGSETVDPYKD
jgi:tRNA-splicing ligase RtcB